MTCATPFLAATGSFHPYKVYFGCSTHGHYESVWCPYAGLEEEQQDELQDGLALLEGMEEGELTAFVRRFTALFTVDPKEDILQLRGCDGQEVAAQFSLTAAAASRLRPGFSPTR